MHRYCFSSIIDGFFCRHNIYSCVFCFKWHFFTGNCFQDICLWSLSLGIIQYLYIESSWIFGTILPLASQMLSFISCLWLHHSLYACTEHECIYYRIINYPHSCQLKLIQEIQNWLWCFYLHKQFMYYIYKIKVTE